MAHKKLCFEHFDVSRFFFFLNESISEETRDGQWKQLQQMTFCFLNYVTAN